jgi:K(+)-stimulated pyrophosphate-energized sodium pump
MENVLIFLIAPIGAIFALFFAFIFYKQIMKVEEGTKEMIEIAEAVRKGAKAYLRQQYKVVVIFFVIAFLFLGFLSFGLGVQSKWTPFAFLTGGFFSGIAGFI